MPTLLRDRITRADLDWWLALAPSLTWTFAKTYAETAPHSYVVSGRTKGMTRDDYIRAGAVIRTFGQPAKYYSMTNIYLENEDASLKWWAMDKKVSNTTLINQATTERVYGEQNAPSTASDTWSDFDEIATQYDELYSPVDGNERVALLRLIESLGLQDAPRVLDLGCRTGGVLDLGITTPDRYVGVDPSQAMLNELLMKHPRATVIPSPTMPADLGAFDLAIAAFGAASHYSAADLTALTSCSSGATILMRHADTDVPSRLWPRDNAARGGILIPTRRNSTTSVGKFAVEMTKGRNHGE